MLINFLITRMTTPSGNKKLPLGNCVAENVYFFM